MTGAPGEPDPEIYGDSTQPVDDETQLPAEDTLEDRGVDDLLDEGYSPPEREPRHLRRAPTGAEQHEGESLDERLAQEEPEPDPYEEADHDPGAGDPRAGRLVAPDEGLGEDVVGDEVARDVGIDGGAASAEEAAVHVIDEDAEGFETEPDVGT
jgi:hypothetical protein